jgi:chromosome segregation and condensation protein ScpB
VAREIETDPVRLRLLSDRARRLADGARQDQIRRRLMAAAAEYEQRAVEIELDNGTGQ